MRPALALLAALSAAAPLAAAADDGDLLPPDVVCREEKATCKEDCSLDYGMSEATRGKVPKCLADCEQAEVICLARHVAKRRAGTARADRERYTLPQDTVAEPPMDDDLPPVRKRTSTRASEMKGVPDKKPEGYEEKVFSKPVPGAPEAGDRKTSPKLEMAPAPPPEEPEAPPAPAKKKKPPRKRAPVAPPVTPAE